MLLFIAPKNRSRVGAFPSPSPSPSILYKSLFQNKYIVFVRVTRNKVIINSNNRNTTMYTLYIGVFSRDQKIINLH